MAFSSLPPSGNAVPAGFLLRAGGGDFTAEFAAHGGHKEDRILFTDSATSALYIACRGLADLRGSQASGPSLRVAVPAWCCPSVPQAVLQAGLVPVPVDLDPATLAYHPAALEAARAHPQGLAAIILVHFFAMPAPCPEGDWSGTLLLRDCAQDFDYRPAPGDPAPCIYSFGRGKALNAGHGGALCIPLGVPAHHGNDALLARCRKAWEELPASHARIWPKALAINLLSEPHWFRAVSAVPGLGIGATVWDAPLAFARMAAGFPRLGSACLEAWLQRRDYYRQLMTRYRRLIWACDREAFLSPMAPPLPPPSTASIPARFPIRIPDAALRAGFFSATRLRFGGVTRMYPSALPDLPGAPPFLDGAGDYPGARVVAESLLTLPITAHLMGTEDRFFEGLADILMGLGVLRQAPAPRAAPDWSPAPAMVSDAAFLPHSMPYL